MLLDCISRVLKSTKTCELMSLCGLRAPKLTPHHHYHLVFKRSPAPKRSVILHVLRVVLPLGKYSPTRNTAHQGVGNMKYPNYHCLQHCRAALEQLAPIFKFFSLHFLVKADVFLINSIVFMKIILKALFQPFSLSAHIYLEIQH